MSILDNMFDQEAFDRLFNKVSKISSEELPEDSILKSLYDKIAAKNVDMTPDQAFKLKEAIVKNYDRELNQYIIPEEATDDDIRVAMAISTANAEKLMEDQEELEKATEAVNRLAELAVKIDRERLEKAAEASAQEFIKTHCNPQPYIEDIEYEEEKKEEKKESNSKRPPPFNKYKS